jgi:hypothetical protein
LHPKAREKQKVDRIDISVRTTVFGCDAGRTSEV